MAFHQFEPLHLKRIVVRYQLQKKWLGVIPYVGEEEKRVNAHLFSTLEEFYVELKKALNQPPTCGLHLHNDHNELIVDLDQLKDGELYLLRFVEGK